MFKLVRDVNEEMLDLEVMKLSPFQEGDIYIYIFDMVL
jgi:hypothetical protein